MKMEVDVRLWPVAEAALPFVSGDFAPEEALAQMEELAAAVLDAHQGDWVEGDDRVLGLELLCGRAGAYDLEQAWVRVRLASRSAGDAQEAPNGGGPAATAG